MLKIERKKRYWYSICIYVLCTEYMYFKILLGVLVYQDEITGNFVFLLKMFCNHDTTK